MKRKLSVLILILLAVQFAGCASALKTVNYTRDHVYAPAVAQATVAHDSGLLTGDNWNQVRQKLLEFGELLDDAYLAIDGGASLDVSQFQPGDDPAHLTLYDLIEKYSQGRFQ